MLADTRRSPPFHLPRVRCTSHLVSSRPSRPSDAEPFEDAAYVGRVQWWRTHRAAPRRSRPRPPLGPYADRLTPRAAPTHIRMRSFALNIGELSQPVFTDSGVHLIWRTG